MPLYSIVLAAHHGRQTLVKFLLDNKCDVFAVDIFGNTAIYLAVHKGKHAAC